MTKQRNLSQNSLIKTKIVLWNGLLCQQKRIYHFSNSNKFFKNKERLSIAALMGDNRESLISHFKATHLTPETPKDGQTLSTEEIERYTIRYITFF